MLSVKKDKKVFLVSKDIINKLVNPIELFSKKTVKHPNCSNCKFKNSSNEFAIRYCSDFCKFNSGQVLQLDNNLMKKFKSSLRFNRSTSIKSIKSDYKSVKSFKLNRLTKKKSRYVTPLQSKVMLTYFYISNNKGIVNLASKNDIAKFIGCSIKSIDNTNIILERLGLISYQVNSNNELTVVIKNYSNMHTVGGNGYLVVSQKLFKKLISIKKIHEMRLALKVILLFDGNKVYGNKTTFSESRLKDFLPSYMQRAFNFKKFIFDIIALFKEGLEVDIISGSILSFRISDDYEGKSLRKDLKSEYKNKFTSEIEESKLTLTAADDKIKVLSQLSIEYDFNKVLYVFKNAPTDALFDTVNDFGATMRYYLEHTSALLQSFSSVA